MSQTLFEKLQLNDEKNLLIQGIPSTIEKQFVKLSFAKYVTPLLKSKKIDFALVFAINYQQLTTILKEVLPALDEGAKLWIAYPQVASKIASDLNRGCTWNCLAGAGYESVRQISIDNVWTALRFKKTEDIKVKTRASANGGVPAAIAGVHYEERRVDVPDDLLRLFGKHQQAHDFFETLSFTNKKEFAGWIAGAKKDETRQRRLAATVEKLLAGKRNPSEK